MKPVQLTIDQLFNQLQAPKAKAKAIKLVEVFVGLQNIRLLADGKLMLTTETDAGIDPTFLAHEIEDLFIADLSANGSIDECINDDTQWDRISLQAQMKP